ncbi:GNAT family N-acetyltransferase [Saccharothrix sp. HUAS TT1]|uniref:GNAT family N-acetyltransferase n=1 Tax=unclassified Saccharothrix TaxID=2593673 RepID=UPI00345BCF70
MNALPAGHTARSPRPDDAEAILGLVQDYTTAVIGFADYTLEDMRDELARPGLDLERDAWLVLDAAGAPAGYATTDANGGSGLVDLDVVARDPALADWLFARALDRARAMAREHGLDGVTTSHGVYRDDVALAARVAALGMEVATTFHRMRVDHVGDVPPPEPAPGLVLRQAVDEDARRVAHEVWTASFASHFGFMPTTYEEWHEKQDRKSIFDWSGLWLAELDGRPVGFLERTDQFADEGRGYVGHLGVLAEARGRGVAKHLLRHAFHLDAADGRVGTVLHVDSNNRTPALGLYESVGMRPVLVIDVWRGRLD